MDFDTYWKSLVGRVYQQKELLTGPEERLYRLTCIYGETMVDGVEAYFDRRHAEFPADMDALIEHGFADIAADFRQAREVMFGDIELTDVSVLPIICRLLDEDEADQPILEEINRIYDRLITRLPDVIDVRDKIGVENGLFEGKS